MKEQEGQEEEGPAQASNQARLGIRELERVVLTMVLLAQSAGPGAQEVDRRDRQEKAEAEAAVANPLTKCPNRAVFAISVVPTESLAEP